MRKRVVTVICAVAVVLSALGGQVSTASAQHPDTPFIAPEVVCGLTPASAHNPHCTGVLP